MSSAPGPLATHKANLQARPHDKHINLQLKTCEISYSQYVCKCLQEAVFTTTQNLFKLDSTPPLPHRSAAEHCACCIQENGGSIQFLLTASSCHCQKRTLQELHTQSPSGTSEFYSTCQHLCLSQILDSSFAEFLEMKHWE